MKSKVIIIATALIWALTSCSSQPAAPSPTPMPLPTYTPYPTFTPYPTLTPAPVSNEGNDIAQRHDLVDAINDYRVAHGAPALRVSYPLMQIAASRVYLGLVPVDLNKVQIDPRIMPSNYKWQEWTAWGDTPQMLSLRTAKSILDYWLTWKGMPKGALATEYTEIGAAYLCNGARCAFVIIFGGY